MDDNKLVSLIKKKPNHGITAALDLYGALVKTIVTRIIGYNNQNDIEECISDIFLELWKSIDRFDIDKGSLKNYLISIARNISINYYRKNNKHELIPLDENEINVEISIDNNIFDNINRSIIENTLNELPEPDKEIFIRRYYYYEPIKVIADMLHVSTKLVENKLYRGKEKLKQILINSGINI